ncbi:MAG: 2-hydroxyglutaryl-CoA dehydratase [Alphaproteobacteria bacterium]|nr:2-hydroxyglutaryl-CoA dehydratase [Alphaproteobacteria bacterium]
MTHPHENSLSPEEIEQQLAEFAEAESRRLGLEREQWVEPINTRFTAAQRPHTTMLVSGLSLAHDQFAVSALRGIGYVVEMLDVPDNAALQFGKEFGNRGQCNPTYFTVGNLVKHLCWLRDEKGLSTQEIIDGYLFLTAGACGPCRFGTYVTEYRKALRDAGFEGFRVMLFQQQGGVKQATGDEVGLKIDAQFGLTVVRALMAGDVINLMGYRIRPYEVVEGATNAALAECKRIVQEALETGTSVVHALYRCRKVLAAVEVDRTTPKPVVSIIGEFWAMTTEGDGNYHLQEFLEREGAEVDVQIITNWILFMIWENRYDTLQRLELREHDEAKKGLAGKDGTKKLWGLTAAEPVIRATFQLFAKTIGLHGYHLPDMDEILELAQAHYDTHVRGGEAHMEVGKLVHFVRDQVNHMTVSVKPFGCMPSSGVSDGVQSIITTHYPEAIFLPIETTGDGEVNVHSRVQMMLFKARQRAREEFEAALAESGLDEETFRARVHGSRRWRSTFGRPPHKTASVVTNLVYAVA